MLGSSRSVLILLNGLFFLVSLIILSVGLWSQWDENFSTLWESHDIGKVVNARLLESGSLLLIVSGFTSILVSFIGLWGAVKSDKCFLSTYCLLMVAMVIVELIGAAVLVSYKSSFVKRATLQDIVHDINKGDGGNSSIPSPEYKLALLEMNTLQPLFECCGCDGPGDYKNLSLMISCQVKTPVNSTINHNNNNNNNTIYFQKGCYSAIVSYINNHLPVILFTALAMIIMQMFFLAMSIRTCGNIRYEGYENI
jgi:hypothetical protein